MDTDSTDNFESPLDEVLDDLPQENPPKDLHQRCVNALDEIDAERGIWSAPWWYAPLRNVVATAAVLVLAVGLFTLLPLFMGAKRAARSVTCFSNDNQLRVAAQPLAPPGEPVPKPAAGSGMAPGMAGPAPAPTAGEVTARTEAPLRDATEGWVDHRLDLERERLAFDRVEAEEELHPVPQVIRDGHAKRVAKPAESVSGTQAIRRQALLQGQPPQAPGVQKPWRDLSGARQVIVDKELELEVKNVEKSYGEARSIVEKHGGFVASDEISIDAHALDTAVLTIRLPRDGFEAAITELRELGRVIRLVGESQDVTQEYFSQGAEIRSRADREQMLVDKYEKETNVRTKRRLKAQIEQLRHEMRREKEILTKLAEETHWPTLQLTLKERGGPAGFLSEMLERSGHALAWVGATAIIWVPLVVLLTLFWGRHRRHPAGG